MGGSWHVSLLKYDDGRGNDDDGQEDKGVPGCQGDLVLLQEKLANWLWCVLADRDLTAGVCVFVLLILSFMK